MKIGIVAQDYNPGQTGGTETYFKTLLNGLPAVAKSDQFLAYVQPQYLHTLESHYNKLNILPIPVKSLSQRVYGKINKKYVWDKYHSDQLDLIHFCFQHAESTQSKKVIVTFNDIQDSYLPDYFSKEERRIRRTLNTESIKNSTHIIAISQFTKDCLVEKYRVDKNKISVVHIGVDKIFFRKTTQTNNKKYFFYPAVSWPHKNHIRLLKAFKLILKKYPDYQLILSGAKKQSYNDIVRYVQQNKMQNDVKMLGFIDYQELPKLYANAFALIFPSLFEGFGIPLVEAMAIGCPVLSANTTSLPEIGGRAALYFNPLSVDEMAASMEMIIRDNSRRQQLILNGHKQAKKFTQDTMIKNTLQVYKKVAKI